MGAPPIGGQIWGLSVPIMSQTLKFADFMTTGHFYALHFFAITLKPEFPLPRMPNLCENDMKSKMSVQGQPRPQHWSDVAIPFLSAVVIQRNVVSGQLIGVRRICDLVNGCELSFDTPADRVIDLVNGCELSFDTSGIRGKR